jgi:surfeit locus 1 family protein
MPKFRLRFALWPTLAVAAGVALGLALGVWQLERGAQKTRLAEQITAANRDAPIALPAAEMKAEDVLWRRVEVRGRFDPAHAVLIDNRVVQGVAGYDVVMPLQIGASDRYVLVNRGWIAGTGSREALPVIATPAAPVTVIGLATVPSHRFLELSREVTAGKVWENLTLERYRAAVPLQIQPVVIEQENETDDGLRRVWAAPDLGIQRHYGYAFQWFALAAALLIFYVATHVRKNAQQD